MWSYAFKPGVILGEGIATGIPPLTAGKKYAFSIFKRYFADRNFPSIDLDNFYIVLLKCNDYLAIRTDKTDVPNIPSDAQIIYCETHMTNNTFERVFQSFRANDNYDVAWIFPKQTFYSDRRAYQAWLEVTKFEMIDIDNFSAGPTPNPIYPNCNVTLGPISPNCGVEGAVFTWYGPNGQVIPVSADNQKIKVDASIRANTGIWTLKMVVPKVVTTNNTCSSPGIIQASVNVPACDCGVNITPAGPIDYYYLQEANIGKYTFTTSSTTALQWFVNDQAIVGANGQTFTYTFIGSPATTSYNVRVASNGCLSLNTTVNLIPYGGCPQSPNPPSPNRPLNNHCWPSSITTPWFYCKGQSSYLQTFDMGSNATYSWAISNYNQLVDLTITSQNQNTAFVNVANNGSSSSENAIYAKSELNGYVKVFDYYVRIPKNTRNIWQTCSNGIGSCYAGFSGFDNETYTFPGLITYVSNPAYQNSVGTNTLICSGVLSASFQVKFSNPGLVNNFSMNCTNNNYPGDCYNQTIIMTMLPYACSSVNQNPGDSSQQLITVFPNPATNQVTITSTESISYIEISDLLNPTLKKLKVNGTKSATINIFDIRSGIYNCKITTNKGIENQKLIIKR